MEEVHFDPQAPHGEWLQVDLIELDQILSSANRYPNMLLLRQEGEPPNVMISKNVMVGKRAFCSDLRPLFAQCPVKCRWVSNRTKGDHSLLTQLIEGKEFSLRIHEIDGSVNRFPP
jgi:hypothetical protein